MNLKFPNVIKENRFFELLDYYSTKKLSRIATNDTCDDSIQGAIINMFFLHSLEEDITLKLGTTHSEKNTIDFAWVETLHNDFYIQKPDSYVKTLYAVEIPKHLSVEEILDIFYERAELNEDTRTALISKSRGAGEYKDKSRGKNRFERKKYSKVANTVKQYNNIDMNALFKQDILKVSIPINGETDDYTVTVKIEGVVAEIAKNIKNNKNQLEYRTIVQSLTKMFNTTDIYVKCTCPDHTFNYAHWNIINKVSVDDTSNDPGPGKGIANPNDSKGRGCKHILLVLANGDWMMKVASVINNYVHYASENMQKAFLKLIFPKLYGVSAEEAAENNIVEDNEDLETHKDLIDLINNYGRNRGKFKKGSNKNPVTNTGPGDKKEKEEKPEESENDAPEEQDSDETN